MFLHPVKWPGNAKCAAAITFDIDADSLIRDARREDGELRLQAISMGQYGPTAVSYTHLTLPTICSV